MKIQKILSCIVSIEQNCHVLSCIDDNDIRDWFADDCSLLAVPVAAARPGPCNGLALQQGQGAHCAEPVSA
jgi:hypothetical protein